METKKQDEEVMKKTMFLRRLFIFNFFRVPIIFLLSVLPKNCCKRILLVGSRRKETRTKICASAPGTFKALEAIYTFDKSTATCIDRFWYTLLDNPRAVRNRLILVRQQLKEGIEEIGVRKDKIFILSLASGSGRAVIETITELEKSFSTRIMVRFIDISRDALNYSKYLAESYGVNEQCEWYRSSVFDPKMFCNEFQPDIVEASGILDYLDDEYATKFIALCHRNLAWDGRMIVSNIVPNMEQSFITKALNWQMIYRTPRQLQEIVIRAGFTKQKIVIEPLGIHALCVATKEKMKLP